jgi:hypothetical protein
VKYARKVDSTQPLIVTGLEQAGVKVYVIEEPCDLLCYFWCKKHDRHCWQTLECKPLIGVRHPKARRRTDQPEQNQFLEDTKTPVVTSATEALLALSVH